MFEKEAEEWRNSLNYEIDNDTFNNIVIPCIEFGYNKANKWHYVKNGDLPKEEGVYLTYRKNGFQLLAFDGEYWVTGVQDDVYNTIIAWKEIVLPELKEIKENE